MTWSRSRRFITVAGGFVLGALALALGLTAMAQGAQVEPAGAVAISGELLVALGGFYLLAAGLWGAWFPATTRASVRSMRILLSWAVVVSALFCLGLPLTRPATMTRAEWVSFVVVAAYLLISLTAIGCIVRKPRLTVTLLGLAAAYAAVSLAYAMRNIVASGTNRLVGPAAAFSFALSGSLLIAIVAAFLLAWPLRASGHRALGGG